MKNLTIAIPTYNMELYLDRCLKSLIIDDLELLKTSEVLIVNDGSKDNSLQIALKYKKKYPDVFRVIDKPNGNYGSCLNRAIKESSGKYFKTLDADDWYDTKAFAEYLSILQDLDDNVDLIITNEVHILGDRFRDVAFDSNMQSDRVYKFNYEFLKNADFKYFIQTSTYKTSIVKQIQMSEGISYTDMEVRYLTMKYIKTCKVYNDIRLYHYVLGREGQSVSMCSYVSHANHMYTIIKRFLSVCCKETNVELQRCMVYTMNALLVKYYVVNLFYNVSDRDYNNFCELHKQIKSCCPIVYDSIISFNRKHIFYYVHYWEMYPLLTRMFYRLFRRPLRF